MEQEIKDKLQVIEQKVVSNSYLIDTLLFYCNENSDVNEVSQAASVLEVISQKEQEIFKLISDYRNEVQ